MRPTLTMRTSIFRQTRLRLLQATSTSLSLTVELLNLTLGKAAGEMNDLSTSYGVNGTMFSNVWPGCLDWTPLHENGYTQASSKCEETIVISEPIVVGVPGWKAGRSQYE